MFSREKFSVPLATQVPLETNILEEITPSYLSCATPRASADPILACDKNPVITFKGLFQVDDWYQWFSKWKVVSSPAGDNSLAVPLLLHFPHPN